MPVYAKKINGKQRKAMKQYEAISGFEFMHQEEIDDGEISFNDAWVSNVRWLEDILAEVINIDLRGCSK